MSYRVIEAFRNAFPDLVVTLEDQTAEGDKVVSRYTGRGTRRGEFLGIAPTGREVELSGVTIFRLRGGNIVEGWDFYDGLGLLRQLGAMPTSGEGVGPSHRGVEAPFRSGPFSSCPYPQKCVEVGKLKVRSREFGGSSRLCGSQKRGLDLRCSGHYLGHGTNR